MMDPLRPETFNHCFAEVNGIRMHYIDEGKGPRTILCVHGFPDLWYGWRYQIPHLVSLGYRVIVPDIRGYGQTDAPTPEDPKSYTAKTVVEDLVGLLDKLNIEKAVWASHDWGAFHAWRAAMWHPERIIGLAAFCVPYSPTLPVKVTLDMIVQKAPNWKYQQYFRRPETLKELDEHIVTFITAMLRARGANVAKFMFNKDTPVEEITIKSVGNVPRDETLLSEPELQYHISEYKRKGLAGPLNYYKVHELNWEEEHAAGFCMNSIDLPCLMVTAGHDPALPAEWADGMTKFVPNLTREHIQDSSHWILIEQKEQSNAALERFLKSLNNTSSKL